MKYSKVDTMTKSIKDIVNSTGIFKGCLSIAQFTPDELREIFYKLDKEFNRVVTRDTPSGLDLIVKANESKSVETIYTPELMAYSVIKTLNNWPDHKNQLDNGLFTIDRITVAQGSSFLISMKKCVETRDEVCNLLNKSSECDLKFTNGKCKHLIRAISKFRSVPGNDRPTFIVEVKNPNTGTFDKDSQLLKHLHKARAESKETTTVNKLKDVKVKTTPVVPSQIDVIRKLITKISTNDLSKHIGNLLMFEETKSQALNKAVTMEDNYKDCDKDISFLFHENVQPTVIKETAKVFEDAGWGVNVSDKTGTITLTLKFK